MMSHYEEVKNDESKNIEDRKIATFKWDAIYYLLYAGHDLTEKELGEQVAAMVDFITLYADNLSKAKNKSAQQLVIATFRNASIENSLFNDTDKEIVYAYVDNDSFITNFSLDTDWVSALAAVQD